MATFKKVKLRDIAKINPDPVEKDFKYQVINYVDISSVGTGKLEKYQVLDINNAPSRAKRLVKPDDIIISTVRPNRRSFYYFKNPKENTVVSTGFAVLRAIKNNNPRYLYYAITDQSFTEYLTKNAKGAAYPAIDANIIYDGEIFVPGNINDQSRIASVLTAYDDLIENNERRIRALEEMAQQLYKEWFVRFRFPGHEQVKLKESSTEYGMIPEGWEVKRLGTIANIVSGYAFKSSDFQETGIPVIKIKNITSNNTVDTDKTDFVSPELLTDKLSKYLLKDRDIIIAMTGATAGKTGRISSNRNMLLNQRVAKIDPNIGFYTFVWGSVETQESQRKFYNLAGGAAQPNMSATQIEDVKILVPESSLLAKYDNIALNILKVINQSLKMNSVIEKQRDLLLPQLITGKRNLKS